MLLHFSSKDWLESVAFHKNTQSGADVERGQSDFVQVMASLLCLCLWLSLTWGSGDGGGKQVTFLGPPTQTVSNLASNETLYAIHDAFVGILSILSF